ncbi:uncharacterized protein LOC135691941 [Rhopilema esculentum]|uniref:uncharacterized protein LOC135691941 n=1 Tax=Rhopilema esculentum TaxID=499914 RepID=UPI0031CDD57C|eukprot:gene9371-17076_t
MGGPERQCSDDDTATLRLKRELERKSEALVKAERAKTLLRRKVDELAKKNSCLRDEFQATFDGLIAEKNRLSTKIEEQKETINGLMKFEPLKIKKVLKYVKYFMEAEEDKTLDIKKMVEESELFRRQFAEKGKALINESFSPAKGVDSASSGTKDKTSDGSKVVCAFQILLERYIEQNERKDRLMTAFKAEADEIPYKDLELWNLKYQLRETEADLAKEMTSTSCMKSFFDTEVYNQKKELNKVQNWRETQRKCMNLLQMELEVLIKKEPVYRHRLETRGNIHRLRQRMSYIAEDKNMQVDGDLQDIIEKTIHLIDLYVTASQINKRLVARVRRLENYCTLGRDEEIPSPSKETQGKTKSFFDRFRRKKIKE